METARDATKDDASKLEIYKLHAQAADDVSRRRDSANRMYLAASTSVGIAMGVTARFGGGEVPAWIVVTGLGVLGVLVQMGWMGILSSYRQLNSAKFKVLLRLEEALTFDFYTQEWKEMGQGEDKKRYYQLTLAERTLPKVLLIAFGTAALVATGCEVLECYGTGG